jgi:hypothetical protein
MGNPMSDSQVMELIAIAAVFAALGLTYFLCKSQHTRDTIKAILRAIQIDF